MPKSILRYLLDKESNFNQVFLDFFSDSLDIPNKSSKHEINNYCMEEVFPLKYDL